MDAVSQLLQDQFVGDSALSPPLALALPDIFRYRAPVNAQVYNFIGKYTFDNIRIILLYHITIIHPQSMVQIVHVYQGIGWWSPLWAAPQVLSRYIIVPSLHGEQSNFLHHVGMYLKNLLPSS